MRTADVYKFIVDVISHSGSAKVVRLQCEDDWRRRTVRTSFTPGSRPVNRAAGKGVGYLIARGMRVIVGRVTGVYWNCQNSVRVAP